MFVSESISFLRSRATEDGPNLSKYNTEPGQKFFFIWLIPLLLKSDAMLPIGKAFLRDSVLLELGTALACFCDLS